MTAWALLVALDSRRADLYVQLFAADRTTPLAEPAAVLPDRLASYVAGLIGGASAAGRRRSGRACRRCSRGARAGSPGRRDARLGARRARRRGRGASRCVATGAAAAPVRPLYLRPPDVTLPKGRNPPASGRRAMSLRIAPLPAGAAEPLALMHRACFPEDPWDAASFARLLALSGVFGYLAWLDEPRRRRPATMPWAASFWRAISAAKPRS